MASDEGCSVADADGSSLAASDGSSVADGSAEPEALDDGSMDESALTDGAGGSVGSGVGSGVNRDGTPAMDRTMISAKIPRTVRIQGLASRSSRVGSDPR